INYSDANYGTWTFNGAVYEGQTEANVNLGLTNQQHTSKTCVLQVRATNLTAAGNKQIEAGNLRLSSNDGYFGALSLSTGYQTVVTVPSAVDTKYEAAKLE